MQNRGLDRLFDRFRRQGDVEALGEVFDRTSEELLRVAVFLTRDGAEADDLLQSTFLSAIQRASRYDGSRSLVPWMLGILVNHAREHRRHRQRVPDPDRLGGSEAGDPHAALEERELDEEIGRALETLSARDRELLEATLRQGVAPIDFARQHGLAPGTVRMQLHRGIERLRHALPAGLALGGAAVLSGGRGHAAVRGKILEAARHARPGIAPAAAPGSSLALGQLTVSKNLALTVLSLALVAGLFWVAGRGAGGARSTPFEAEDAQAAKSPIESGPLLAPVATAVKPTRPIVREALTERVSMTDEPYERALSGVAGRLVEPDGSPSAGQEVVLIDLAFDDVRRAVSLATTEFVAPQVVVDRTMTGVDGRFVLHGARSSSLHALSGTARSPRVPLRILGESLAPGETRDIGDVLLPARGGLSGQVVDSEGQPVVGARVRMGPIPVEALEFGAGELRPDSFLFLRDPALNQILPVPKWATRLEEHLGLARTMTDAEGRFAFADLAVGAQTIVADQAGLLAAFREVVVGEGPTAEPALVLERGHDVRGRVTMAGGDPVSVEVLLGPTPRTFPVAILQRIGRTDSSGRFAASGLPPGRIAVAARRDRFSPWTVVFGEEDAQEIDLELPEQGTLRLRILDARGLPVPDPEVLVVPSPVVIGHFDGLVPVPRFQERMERSEDGLSIKGLTQGPYGLTVRADGYATVSHLAQVDDTEVTIDIALTAAPTLQVLVRDASSRAGVSRARVSLLQPNSADGTAHDAALTDANGGCRLRPQGLRGKNPMPLLLRVEHPGYATAFHEVPFGVDRAEVSLGLGGRLQVFTQFGTTASGDGLLVLTRRGGGDEDMHLLRLDSMGQGRRSMLSVGTWDYVLTTLWPRDVSMLALLASGILEEEGRAARGTFEIQEGMTTELVLEGDQPALADLGAGAASIEGTLHIGGRPGLGCFVSVQGPETREPARLSVGPDGTFRFENAPADAHVLLVECPSSQDKDSFGWHSLKGLVEGETRRVDIDWDLEEAVVLVLDADRPVRGATVTAEGASTVGQAKTGRDGRCRVSLLGPGPFRVSARHSELGSGRALVDEGRAEIRIVLDSSVACAGVARVPNGHQGPAKMMVHSSSAALAIQVDLTFENGTAEFRVGGLEVGEYFVNVLAPGLEVSAQQLELGPQGNESLDLLFEPVESAPGAR